MTASLMIVKDILLSLIGQIAFREIGRRYAKRLAIYALEKLRDEEWTGKVTDETIDDIISELKSAK